MTERFKQYLEAKFRAISPTRAAMEYRKDTLVKLEELAQDYRIKGIGDDETIYNLCIDSLGDFDATLKEFETSITELPIKNNKRRIVTIGAIAAVSIVLIVYLVVSMTGALPWALSWLILLGSIFVGYTAATALAIVKAKKTDKYIVARAMTMFCFALWFTFAYLIIHLALRPEARLPYDWMTFLVLPIGIILEDVVFGFATKSKITIPELLAWLIMSSVLIYVMCGIAGVMTWGMGWLLPVITVFVAIAIAACIVITLLKRDKKNEMAKYAELKSRVDEEYYTQW